MSCCLRRERAVSVCVSVATHIWKVIARLLATRSFPKFTGLRKAPERIYKKKFHSILFTLPSLRNNLKYGMGRRGTWSNWRVWNFRENSWFLLFIAVICSLFDNISTRQLEKKIGKMYNMPMSSLSLFSLSLYYSYSNNLNYNQYSE